MGTAKQSLDAAKEFAEKQGINAVVLSDCIEGEAREVGGVLGSIALGTERDLDVDAPGAMRLRHVRSFVRPPGGRLR